MQPIGGGLGSEKPETTDLLPLEHRPWREWLQERFPSYVSSGFAPRHIALWEWIDALTPGVRPRPKVDIWPRGGAKSTSAELGCARVCVRQSRHFVLYVSDTQDQADKHVQAIATLLEALDIPRAVNVYGNSKGWRHQELRTAVGFNVAAYGLDTAARGAKIDNFRPDLIVFDDVDSRHDSKKRIQKKIEMITQTILPAGSPDCAVLFIQNKIHKDSIAAQLADGRADFLLDRLPVVEEPAVYNLEFERRQMSDGTLRYVITKGEASWEGQSLTICEQQMSDWGRIAFQREAQHKVKDNEKGLWKRERDIEPFRVAVVPQLHRIGVAIDPSATSTGNEAGVIVGGIGWCSCRGKPEIHGFILDDRSIQGSPKDWAMAAVSGYSLHKADVLVAEDNNGGEMVEVTISTIPGAPKVKRIHASRGKQTRAEPAHILYEEGRMHHVGEFIELEEELCNWVPGEESPNRLDALVWIVTELMLTEVEQGTPAVGGQRPNQNWKPRGLR